MGFKKRRCALTRKDDIADLDGVRQTRRLVVVLDAHREGVEEDGHEDRPLEVVVRHHALQHPPQPPPEGPQAGEQSGGLAGAAPPAAV